MTHYDPHDFDPDYDDDGGVVVGVIVWGAVLFALCAFLGAIAWVIW
jgi:hypothetical protein